MGAHGEQGSSGAFGRSSAFSSAGSFGAFHDSSTSHMGGGTSSFSTFNPWNLSDTRHYQHIETPPLLFYQHGGSRVTPRQTWSCMALIALVVILSGSLALMLSANDSKQVEMEFNYSRILKANRFLVDRISVKNLEQVPGARLYSFENQPFLNRTMEWTVHHNVLIPGFHHQEWAFWLNQGSKVNVVYDLPPTSSLFIIVARGKANFNNWIQDPSNSDSCLLWRFVHDNGQISFEADNDGDYYFGLGNLDEKSVEKGIDVWRVEISYKARWKTYLLFDGALLFAIFLICLCLCKSCNQHNLQSEECSLNLQDRHAHSREAISERGPILNKKPNLKMIAEANTAVEETSEENVCIICFEKDKNSFFQPCGHCATCYSCGLRVKEASGLCPMCRKPIQDIRKIFTV